MKEDVLGYRVSTGALDACVAEIVAHLEEKSDQRWLACINPHSYVVSLGDRGFADALHDAHWLLPDGIGVVYASRILGGSIKKRVTGPDVFDALHDSLNRKGGASVFFLGGSEQTLDLVRRRFESDFPRLRFAGSYSPPVRPRFSEEETAAMVEAVNAAAPDVLWVALTAPKQEKWIHENRHRLRVPFIGAIGAALDFYAGMVHRPPRAVQDFGLDWLFRLVQQPRRLWRRTFISAPVFVWHVLRARLGRPASAVGR